MASCDFCPDEVMFTGKDGAGVRTYTCEKHAYWIQSEKQRVWRPETHLPASEDGDGVLGEPY